MLIKVKARIAMSYGYMTNYKGLELKYKVKYSKWSRYQSESITIGYTYNPKEDFENEALIILSNLTIEELQDMIKKKIALKIETNQTSNEKLNVLIASKNKELDFEFTFKA